MSEELALGQRELTADSLPSEFSAEEQQLILNQGIALVLDVVKASGKQTVNAAIGALAQNAARGLAAAATSAGSEPAGEPTAAEPAPEPAPAPAEPPADENAGADKES